MKISFYEMLEIPRKATQNQIDNAFARLTAKLDATTSVRGTAETMTQLNILREGYNILSDPEKRAMYDAKLYATEAGIKLMFFPKDEKAVKKLGVETVIFFACLLTSFIKSSCASRRPCRWNRPKPTSRAARKRASRSQRSSR
jgi:DnaJ-class molecular chaperone